MTDCPLPPHGYQTDNWTKAPFFESQIEAAACAYTSWLLGLKDNLGNLFTTKDHFVKGGNSQHIAENIASNSQLITDATANRIYDAGVQKFIDALIEVIREVAQEVVTTGQNLKFGETPYATVGAHISGSGQASPNFVVHLSTEYVGSPMLLEALSRIGDQKEYSPSSFPMNTRFWLDSLGHINLKGQFIQIPGFEKGEVHKLPTEAEGDLYVYRMQLAVKIDGKYRCDDPNNFAQRITDCLDENGKWKLEDSESPWIASNIWEPKSVAALPDNIRILGAEPASAQNVQLPGDPEIIRYIHLSDPVYHVAIIPHDGTFNKFGDYPGIPLYSLAEGQKVLIPFANYLNPHKVRDLHKGKPNAIYVIATKGGELSTLKQGEWPPQQGGYPEPLS